MTVGAVKLYDEGLELLTKDTGHNWDGSSTFQFALMVDAHTFDRTHVTWTTILANVHGATGGYDEIVVANAAVANTTGSIWFNSDDANFGTSVSISARWLVCVRTASAVAGTLVGTDELIFCVDLQT